MSGAGNDFLVLGTDDAAPLGERIVDWTRRVCRRGHSVGADGVLVVEPAGVDRIAVRFLNPDGSRTFCGNGSRCAARFALLRGMARPRMVLVTDWGEVPARVDGEQVSLDLPAPTDLGEVAVRLGPREARGRLVRAGVPHLVVGVRDLGAAPLAVWGPELRHDPRFAPEGLNVNLVEGRAADLRVRTYERGVEAETLACGSGAVAVAYVHRMAGGGEVVTVIPASGRALRVELPGPPDAPRLAVLSGDARRVFEGTVFEEAEE
jgi:diaminopimelate epimerase